MNYNVTAACALLKSIKADCPRLSGRNEREAKSPSPLASSVTSGEPSVSDEAGKQECDIFRDSMLRYAGYSNEACSTD